MQIRTATDVGRVVYERRRARGLTQRALADEVGVSRQWIVEMEGGKSRAELALVLRTLHALDLGITVGPVGPRLEGPAPLGPGVDLDVLIERARGRAP